MIKGEGKKERKKERKKETGGREKDRIIWIGKMKENEWVGDMISYTVVSNLFPWQHVYLPIWQKSPEKPSLQTHFRSIKTPPLKHLKRTFFIRNAKAYHVQKKKRKTALFDENILSGIELCQSWSRILKWKQQNNMEIYFNMEPMHNEVIKQVNCWELFIVMVIPALY